MGSVMIEENVVRAAGASYCMDELEIVVNHRGRGVRSPKRRNMHYEVLGRADLPRGAARVAAHAVACTARAGGDTSEPRRNCGTIPPAAVALKEQRATIGD
jgi:hypothetical protein